MSKTTVKITKDNSADNIYYDLSVINNTAQKVPAAFLQTLTAPIVNNPEDYYLSCVRFWLDTASIPIFIFQDNAYWVTISYDGESHSEPVIFTSQSAVGQYYPGAVYSYQNFIQMINTALQTAFDDFGYTAGVSNLPGVDGPPFLYYDPSVPGLISLYAQTGYDSTLDTPINIYFNNQLYYFFDNFLYYYLGDGLTNHQDYQIIVKNLAQGTNAVTLEVWPGDAANDNTPGSITDYYKMSQEYVATNRWRGPSSVAFLTSKLNVRPDYQSGVNNTPEQSATQTAGTGLPTQAQMTDFIAYISSNDAAGWRGGLYYVPESQYRLLDILGGNGRDIDLNIIWKDQQNNEYQFYTLPFTQTSVKLAFVKKSLYKNTHTNQKI